MLRSVDLPGARRDTVPTSSIVGSPGRAIRALVVLACAAVLIYPAWARGGAYPPWQPPLLWLSAALLALLVTGDAKAGWLRASGPARRFRAGVLGDPILLPGLILLGLLTVQWWNAGRELVLSTTGTWTYTPPRVSWLPFAFSTEEAFEMLVWFVPAGCLVLALRTPWLTGRDLRRVWTLSVIGAGLLGLLDIILLTRGLHFVGMPRAVDTGSWLGIGFPNHAGTYFVLSLFVCVGLLVSIVFERGHGPHFGLQAWLLTGCAVLVTAAIAHSLSRAAIVSGAFGLLIMFLSTVWRYWRTLFPVERMYLVVGVVTISALAFFATGFIGAEHLAAEVQSLFRRSPWDLFGADRALLRRAAAAMAWDHPFFGVGGWGFRHLVSLYLPTAVWPMLRQGDANVHCDPFQFLAEFGLLGFGSMLAIVAILVWPHVRHGMPRRPLVQFPLLGALFVALQSLFGLPFRSPAVLFLWLAVLTVSGRLRIEALDGRSWTTPLNH